MLQSFRVFTFGVKGNAKHIKQLSYNLVVGLCFLLSLFNSPKFSSESPFAISFLSKDLQLFLVGGFNPFEKYDRQIGSFPQKIRMKIEK